MPKLYQPDGASPRAAGHCPSWSPTVRTLVLHGFRRCPHNESAGAETCLHHAKLRRRRWRSAVGRFKRRAALYQPQVISTSAFRHLSPRFFRKPSGAKTLPPMVLFSY